MPALNYLAHQIKYYQYGQGASLLIAFHGFADTGALFGHLEASLSNQYTIIAIDLPFHGETIWKDDKYTGEDIASIIQLFCHQFQKESCSLMCHSMGGRVILAYLEHLSIPVKEIYFLATAGTRYTFTASRFWWPLWLRQRSRRKFVDSEFMIHVFDWFHYLKLMNRSTYLVFKMQLDLPRRRARLLRTWVAMYFFPMMIGKKHIDIINNNNIACYFFNGKKDRITPAKQVQKFIPKIKNSELIITKGNHFFVKDKLAPALQDWRSKQKL